MGVNQTNKSPVPNSIQSSQGVADKLPKSI